MDTLRQEYFCWSWITIHKVQYQILDQERTIPHHDYAAWTLLTVWMRLLTQDNAPGQILAIAIDVQYRHAVPNLGRVSSSGYTASSMQKGGFNAVGGMRRSPAAVSDGCKIDGRTLKIRPSAVCR